MSWWENFKSSLPTLPTWLGGTPAPTEEPATDELAAAPADEIPTNGEGEQSGARRKRKHKKTKRSKKSKSKKTGRRKH